MSSTKPLNPDALRIVLQDLKQPIGLADLVQMLWDAGYRTDEPQSIERFFQVDVTSMIRDLAQERVIYFDEAYGEIRPITDAP